ncbi:glycosyltransferase 87 family protein [Smaragdicoccus niigatensis]|uniref:glycosyltransferase 87 family protein n=1 Tax=Smaragdicoccus niigatensis TaxID=359359 RepID=UPI0009DBDCDE|nr:glycosyltransferase 87 family protein [Smaragdicoccus niigatensis]
MSTSFEMGRGRGRRSVMGLFVLTAAGVAAATLFAFLLPRYELVRSFMIDAQCYRISGRWILNGHPLYSGSLFGLKNGLEFVYPPIAAIPMIPLAMVSAHRYDELILFAELTAVFAACWLSLRMLGYRASKKLAVAAGATTALLLWIEPIWTSVHLGQINIFLMVLVLAGFHLRNRFAPGLIGAAAAMKLTPGLFIAGLFGVGERAKSYVAGASFVGFTLVAAAAMPRNSFDFWTDAVFHASRIAPADNGANFSIMGLIARAFGTPTPPTIVWVAVAGTCAFATFIIMRRLYARGEVLLAVSLCGIAACAISPFSWGHHWVWFLPLILGLAQRAWDDPRWPTITPVALVTAAVACWPVRFPSDRPAFLGLTAVKGGGPAVHWLTNNLYVLVFFALLAYLLVNTRERADEDLMAELDDVEVGARV